MTDPDVHAAAQGRADSHIALGGGMDPKPAPLAGAEHAPVPPHCLLCLQKNHKIRATHTLNVGRLAYLICPLHATQYANTRYEIRALLNPTSRKNPA